MHTIIAGLVYARNCCIALYDVDTELVSYPYFVDEEEQHPGPHRAGSGLVEYVVRTEEPLLATPEVHAELVRRKISGQEPTIDWTPAKSIEDMDKGGTATAVTSIS